MLIFPARSKMLTKRLCVWLLLKKNEIKVYSAYDTHASLPANQKDKEECDVIIMQNIEVYLFNLFFVFSNLRGG